MTEAEPRPIRDIFAEAMRIGRLGAAARPSWAEWCSYDATDRQDWLTSADAAIRVLAAHGLTIARIGDPSPVPAPTSDVVWRYYLAGQKVERIVRRKGDAWQIVDIADGVEKEVMAFTIAQARVDGGIVLTDDPSAKTIAGLGRRLSAALEVMCLCAQATGGPQP